MGDKNYSNQKGWGQRPLSNSKQEEPTEKAKKIYNQYLSYNSKWIVEDTDDYMVKFVEKAGELLAENGLKSSKIRSVYGEIKRIEGNIDNNKISKNAKWFEIKRIKFLALVFSLQNNKAKDFIMEIFEFHKYKSIQFIFKEVALALAKDEFTKALRLLELIDSIDKDNPIKMLKESNIYGLIGSICSKQRKIRCFNN